MNIVFFGSGAFGLPTLKRLAERHTITGVVTQPDRKAGRGGKLTPTPIGAFAQESLAGAAIIKPEKASADEPCARIRSWEADAWVVIAFGQLLRPNLLEDRFAINLHASLLPRWRGAAPINAAMVAGDAETGNSVITLAQRMDAGEVLGQSRRPIEQTHTAGELHDLLAEDGPDLVERVLAEHDAGTLVRTPQDESLVTIAPKLSKAEGWVDFAIHAAACHARIHGLTPWPGVSVEHRGERLKLIRVAETDNPFGGEPGQIMGTSGIVACGGGAGLRLIEVQPAGKRAMAWADYANGRRVEAGERLIGGPPG